ncbi:MAG: diadenylate cyclase CdaA [Lachnospiraceae bacterium]|nr:diadenylate cyclase CdaA [Lachnospiraceae bacterium]
MTGMIEKMKSWVSLLPPIGYTNILEIIILAVLVYEFLLWIKNTRAWELLKGLLVIAAFITVAAILHLTTIMWLIERISTAAIIATVVIFQPELRKALEQLGSRNFISNLIPDDGIDDASVTTINEIIRATFEMAKKKTGALIVIQQNQPLKEIEETGIRINGIVSAALLINIFEKNTPLHDGAVTIVGDKVTAATCYLPLSDTDISKDFGTRHRAALGMSETSDAVTIVVSEETGRVSVAVNGKLCRAQDAEALRSMLPTREQKEMDKNTRFRIFRTTRKEGKA